MLFKLGIVIAVVSILFGAYSKWPQPRDYFIHMLLNPLWDAVANVVFGRLQNNRNYDATWPECMHFPLDEKTTENGKHVVLLGHVFDVSTNPEMFAENGRFYPLTGRDATRSFITGDYSKTGLIDNIDGLSNSQLSELLVWLDHLTKNYKCVGYNPGRFYYVYGEATDLLKSLRSVSPILQENQGDHLTGFPHCNSLTDGSEITVSCDSRSSDSKLLRPRRFFDSGQISRCACVHPTLFQDSRLKTYPKCDPNSPFCSYNIHDVEQEDDLHSRY